MFVVSIRYFSDMNLSNQENTMHTCTAQMPPGKIVGGVFLSRNQLLWVEKLAVGAGSHLVNHRRFLSFSILCCTSASTWQVATNAIKGSDAGRCGRTKG